VWGAKLGQPGSCVGPNVYGALRHHWHSWKYDASKLTFPHGKGFLRKLSTVWSRALRNFRQPWLRPKKLKYIELSGAHCVEPAVIPTEVLVVSVNISKSHLLAHFLFWTKERKKDRILDMYKREVCVSSASATHLLPRLPVCSSLCACQVVAMADGLSRRAARYVCFATVAWLPFLHTVLTHVLAQDTALLYFRNFAEWLPIICLWLQIAKFHKIYIHRASLCNNFPLEPRSAIIY